MFIVQGIFELLKDPAMVRHHDELYDSLLHDTRGILWNHYLEKVDDPTRQIHIMAWDSQEMSEQFGVGDGFQQLRKSLASGGGPNQRMAHPLSPGYWSMPIDLIHRSLPAGREGALGTAYHEIVTVRPGQEAAYLAAVEALPDILGNAPGYLGVRLLQNLGMPNAFALFVFFESLPSGLEITTLDDVLARETGWYILSISSIFDTAV